MKSTPKIPTYSDSENKVFHPVFIYALEQIIAKRNLNDIEIIPQFPTASGPADIVLRRKSTGRVILPIEIKRTQSGVRGLGRRQGRDYQHNVSAFAETPFYCVSNLELTEFFCADQHRPTTISQQIKLNTKQNAVLESGQDNLILDTLLTVIDEIFDIIFCNRHFDFTSGMANFEYSLKFTENGTKYWHESIMPFCFEYIRGSRCLSTQTHDWKSANSYRKTPQRIIDLGKKINFKNIFSPPASSASHFSLPILQDAYLSGKSFGDGDDFSALIGDILFRPQEGIVETDFELARILGIVASHSAGKLNDDDAILDPCAGSGRLLAALIHDSCTTIKPTNVIAIEKESHFAEALSLRLGLMFGNSLTNENSPVIEIIPFEDSNQDLSHVKIAVVNPPFASGVNASETKIPFERAIHSITGNASIVGNGQIGLEALFIELLYHKLQPGTTIAFIFPYQIVSRLSAEYAALRRFIIEKLCISDIVLFPMEGVFESVVKRTMIFVGKIGAEQEDINLIDIQIPIPDVDCIQFAEKINDCSNDCYGVSVSKLSRQELLNNVNLGWKRNIGIGARIWDFCNKNINFQRTIVDYAPEMFRGTMGNHGNTALTVMSKASVPDEIPANWIVGALNNAYNLPKILTHRNAPELSFIPPQDAFDIETPNNRILMEIIETYIKKVKGKFSTKKQKTSQKNSATIISDLKSDQQQITEYSIALPRACREEAKISIIESKEIIVSTNFLLLPIAEKKIRVLLASWIQSIFGQMQLELFAVSEEGMRKLEKNAVRLLYTPDFSLIDDKTTLQLEKLFCKEDFINLSDVHERESDMIWAKILSKLHAESVLTQAKDLLSAAYDERIL